jgi:flagellar export protein FliJ
LFRLARVLKWRESLEREARVERFTAESHADSLAESAREARARREDVPARLLRPDGPVPIDELAAWSGFAEALRRREESLGRRLGAFRPTLEEKVRAHLDLRKEVEGLRKLREKAQAAEKARRERQAQEAADEAASRRKLPPDGKDCPAPAASGGTGTGTKRPRERITGGSRPLRGGCP